MGAPRSLALCHYYLGATDYFRGHFREALAHLTEATALYRRVGAAAGAAVSLQFLGMTETALGRLEVGRQRMEEGVEAAEAGTMRSHTLIRLHAALARNRIDANDPAAARAYAERGLALVEQHGRCICNASIHCVAAVALALTGDLERAAALGEEALARATDLGSPYFLCMSHQARAMIAGQTGAWERAFDALNQARRQAEAASFAYEFGRILLLRAFIHMQRRGPGDLRAATTLMTEALPVFLRLGAQASAAQARSMLGFIRGQARRRAGRKQPSRD
jgi:ATP/maltotriose-dependent transcriptional regulator MalT